MFISVRINKLRLSVLSVITAAAVCFGVFTAVKTVQPENGGLPLCIVMYHGVTPDKSVQNKYMIDPAIFEEDLKYLTDNGYHTVFLSELIGHLENGSPLPDKPVILTFDDGYYNNYVYAFPLLKKYSCKAVISPIASEAYKAKDEKYRSPSYSQCNWDELREMADSGLVELQNHTYDLHRITDERRGADKKQGESDGEYEAFLKADISKAGEAICKETGKAPEVMVFPFGAFCDKSLETVKKTGYKAALDCEEKMNYIEGPEQLFCLHRFLRPNHTSSEAFFKRIFG